MNTLIDISERKDAEFTAKRFSAIVESSIVSKDLNGHGIHMERRRGTPVWLHCRRDIGKPVTILIPPDRCDEEVEILARLRRGDQVDHYETVRRRKDGSLVEISLSVSPIKDVKNRPGYYRAQTGPGAAASPPQGDESPRE